MMGLDIVRELICCYMWEDLLLLVVFMVNVLKDKKEYLDVGMDDVLSKLLLVLVLIVMIKKFWDVIDKEESIVMFEESDKV